MAVKTLSLAISPESQQSAECQFRQLFSRTLAAALSNLGIFPADEVQKVERLAKLVGTDTSIVASWLSGRALPDAFELKKLGKILDMPVDALLNPGASRSDGPAIDETYHCITIHDATHDDGYAIYALPETLRHLNLPRSTMMLSVSSDDMSPIFKPGDVVIYDSRVNRLLTSGFYVLRTHDRFFVRRVQKVGDNEISLICENKAVPPVCLTLGDFTSKHANESQTLIVGLVIGRIKISPFPFAPRS
mgnify:CR=1 FL=1